MIVRAALVSVAALVLPGVASAVVRAGQPFPTNLYTLPDATQLTRVRVALPKPDCGTRPSDCADVDVLNGLDGFNIQPRLSVSFNGPIDLSTVSSSTIFLVSSGGHVVGINQIVWGARGEHAALRERRAARASDDLSACRDARRPRRRPRAARRDALPP
jgi:hypothetical protein